MKIMVMSDIHLGDSDSLFNENRLEQTFQDLFHCPPEQYPRCDVLILNGDILDFAINSFEVSYKMAKPFFQFVYDNEIAKLVLYVPGNHDRQVWDALQWQVKVMIPIEKDNDPVALEQINPAFIDFREDGIIHFPMMKHSTFNMHTDMSNPKIGDVFLKGLIDFGDDPHDFKILVAGPMVFINLNTKANQLQPSDLLMIAHGQHLETGWVFITELLNGYKLPADPSIGWNEEVKFGNYSLEQLEQYNYLITSLIGTDCGQAGEVSRLVYTIERMVRSQDATKQEHYRQLFKMLQAAVNNNLINMFMPYKKGKTFWEKVKDALSVLWMAPGRGAAKVGLGWMENLLTPKPDEETSKYYVPMIRDPNKPTKRYFHSFFSACNVVLHRHFGESGIITGLPEVPGKIIFGHTHYCVLDPAQSTVRYKGTPVELYNSGGWLNVGGIDGVIFQIDHDGIDSSLYHPAPGGARQ